MRINIIERNKVIYLSEKILPSDFENRTTETSYLNEFKIKDGRVKFNSDFLYRLICYTNLKSEIENEYKSNLDIFGGVGITAKIFENTFSYVNEIDPVLLEHLKLNFNPNRVRNQDAFNFVKPEGDNYDLIVADYNDFTLMKTKTDKKYFQSLVNLSQTTERFLIINDCSVFHLKYGEKSFDNYSRFFGNIVTNYQEFHQEVVNHYWDVFGLKVRRIEWFPNSSFILFDNQFTSEAQINKVPNNKTDIINIL